MNTTAQEAIAHLMERGRMTLDQAVAVTSVFMVESGLDPRSENNSGSEKGGVINPKGSIGLEQLNGDRQQKLVDFVGAKGLPAEMIYDSKTQLDFFLTDAANRYPKTWALVKDSPGAKALTYADIIPVIVSEYENPKEPAAEIAKAMAYAREFIMYPLLGPEPGPGTPIYVPGTPSVPTADPELTALASIWEALSRFDKPTAGRMLAYFHDRLGV